MYGLSLPLEKLLRKIWFFGKISIFLNQLGNVVLGKNKTATIITIIIPSIDFF